MHDAKILSQSSLFAAFEVNQKPVNGFILADSGHMLREWLLTPFPNPKKNRSRTTITVTVQPEQLRKGPLDVPSVDGTVVEVCEWSRRRLLISLLSA